RILTGNPSIAPYNIRMYILDRSGKGPSKMRRGAPESNNGSDFAYTLRVGDARELDWIDDESVHLVVTSPPYWTLKEYNERDGQLGAVENYESFHDELDKVWRHCHRVLAKGGRLVCVVGDVCIARRRNNGRHLVMPLHADISVRCGRIGFDYLTPIFW